MEAGFDDNNNNGGTVTLEGGVTQPITYHIVVMRDLAVGDTVYYHHSDGSGSSRYKVVRIYNSNPPHLDLVAGLASTLKRKLVPHRSMVAGAKGGYWTLTDDSKTIEVPAKAPHRTDEEQVRIVPMTSPNITVPNTDSPYVPMWPVHPGTGDPPLMPPTIWCQNVHLGGSTSLTVEDGALDKGYGVS